MLQPSYVKQFRKDLKRIEKSGGRDTEKLKAVISLLVDEKQLPAHYKNHPLSGSFKERHECHIAPDWLLIYKVDVRPERLFLRGPAAMRIFLDEYTC